MGVMEFQERGKVDFGKVVRVDNKGGIAGAYKMTVRVDGSSGAEENGLICFTDSHSPRAVDAIDMRADLIRKVMSVDKHILDACFFEAVYPIIQQWATGDWNQAFGCVIRERAQAK